MSYFDYKGGTPEDDHDTQGSYRVHAEPGRVFQCPDCDEYFVFPDVTVERERWINCANCDAPLHLLDEVTR